MAEIKNFPNNADEYIGAENVMKWLYARTQGVYGAGENLAVEQSSVPAMSVMVTDGKAWLKDANGNGCVCWNDYNEQNGSNLVLPVAAASATQKRIDRIVVSWNTVGYINRPEIIVVQGTPSTTPVPPTIINNGTTRQISLAQISIPAQASAITADMIKDERLDNSVCGLVTEAVEIDTSVMQEQFEALLLVYQGAIQSSIEGTIPPHAFTHAEGGTDPLSAQDIGAIPAFSKFEQSGAFSGTLYDNYEYNLTNVNSLNMNVSTVKARGFISFAASISTPKVTAKATAGDDITKAKAGETWEFDTENGYVLFCKWGAN